MGSICPSCGILTGAGAAPKLSTLSWLSAPALPLQRDAQDTFIHSAGLHTRWPSQGPASFLAKEAHRSTCRQFPVLGLWRSLRCDLLHPDVFSTPNPPARAAPAVRGRQMESNILAGLFPAWLQLQALQRLLRSWAPCSWGGCRAALCHVSPSTGARVWGDKSKLSNLGRGGIWSPCQSQEVFGSEGIGTGRF